MFLILVGFSTFANAEEHEGDGNSKPYEKLDPFTVNLLGLQHVIQVSITLKPATLNIGDRIKLYMPAIRHEIILVLSGKTPEQVETSAGKQELIVETCRAANKALGMTTKNGITNALFESFIIQ
jgi:flagellar FliL protein